MGRHSLSYIAAQQELSIEAPAATRTSSYVGRVGLLAVALGVGAVVAGGTAIASADTPSSNAPDTHVAQSSTQSSRGDDTAADSAPTRSPGRPAARSRGAHAQDGASDDTSAHSNRRSRADNAPDAASSTSASAESSSARTTLQPPRHEIASSTTAAPASATTATLDPPAPSPTDEVTTDYGDIGKWMLQSNGAIANYGGLPSDGKTLLEPINVIFVDPTSKSAFAAALKLDAAMRRAGFPPQLIHSTGFRGFIDDVRYRQRPQGFLAGYSDNFFLLPNNHGRIFGPDPVETSGGYVWSGAFSTEKLAFINGVPRHVYVSSDMARDTLAAKLVASGKATLGGTVSLANSYNTGDTTTGDHDGNAVVVILNSTGLFGAATRVSSGATDSRSCGSAGNSATSLPNSSCATVGITAGRG